MGYRERRQRHHYEISWAEAHRLTADMFDPRGAERRTDLSAVLVASELEKHRAVFVNKPVWLTRRERNAIERFKPFRDLLLSIYQPRIDELARMAYGHNRPLYEVIKMKKTKSYYIAGCGANYFVHAHTKATIKSLVADWANKYPGSIYTLYEAMSETSLPKPQVVTKDL